MDGGDRPPSPETTWIWAPIDAVINWEAIIPKGFSGVLLTRWVVARTCGWLSQSRRLSKDDKAFMYATVIRLMVRRLAKP